MSKSRRRRAEPPASATTLRIIGGRFRGRLLQYEPLRSGERLVTRPMKHRLRETIFNLVGSEAAGAYAVDLFAGTGALGLEALSRGAAHAALIERHVPTARVIEDNIKSLGVEEQSTLIVTSAFAWGAQLQAGRDAALALDSSAPHAHTLPAVDRPWLVFCSPPYDFFCDRRDEMVALIAHITAAAPAGSVVVVEADERFDFSLLASGGRESHWDVRSYPPALIGVWRSQAQPYATPWPP